MTIRPFNYKEYLDQKKVPSGTSNNLTSIAKQMKQSSVSKTMNVKDDIKPKPRFFVDNFTIVDELLLLLNKTNLDDVSLASSLTRVFENTFTESIKVADPAWAEKDNIFLMSIVANPNNLNLLYTTEFQANWDKDTKRAYLALYLRLFKMQSMMICTSYIIHRMSKPSKMFQDKQKGLLSLLETQHFKRLPSMLKLMPGEAPATFRSTIHHVVSKLKPLEAEVQQLLHVF